MFLSIDQLKYERVLNTTFGGLITGDSGRDAWVHRQAEEMQAGVVTDAIREVGFNAVILSQRPLERDAIFHLRYGVAHRTKFIWVALRRLLALAPPGRVDPVSLDDVEALASDLNVIYLNIRGTLDNLAWTLRAQCSSPAVSNLHGQYVDLFGRRFLDVIDNEKLRDALQPFWPWYGDLKGRRDPAAHRIPLSVPPSILDEAAQQEYAELDTEHAEATGKALTATSRALKEKPTEPLTLETAIEIGRLFDDARKIHTDRQTVGRFPSLFLHHPDEPALPIYPTVPEDVCSLVAIAEAVMAIIEQQIPML